MTAGEAAAVDDPDWDVILPDGQTTSPSVAAVGDGLQPSAEADLQGGDTCTWDECFDMQYGTCRSIYLYIYMSMHISMDMPMHMSMHVSICMSIHMQKWTTVGLGGRAHDAAYDQQS